MKDGRRYLELDCCLSEFDRPCIMDVKMGVRTFLTAETSVSKPRYINDQGEIHRLKKTFVGKRRHLFLHLSDTDDICLD